MGRIYTVPFANRTLTAAGGDADLFALKVGVLGTPFRLLGWDFGQESDHGDSEAEGMRLEIRRFVGGTFTAGSGGVAVTPVPLLPRDVAADFTARASDTTAASTSGTDTLVWATARNLQLPDYIPVPPEFRFPVLADDLDNALIVKMATTLGDDAIFSGTAWVEELT